MISPDGQMIFFTENPIVFKVGEFFAIQSMSGLPPLPPGRILVGQGYNLVASSSLTRVITGSIIIGSSLLVAANVGARGLGLAGYLVAGVLGLALVISIIRSRNL